MPLVDIVLQTLVILLTLLHDHVDDDPDVKNCFLTELLENDGRGCLICHGLYRVSVIDQTVLLHII